MIRRIGRYYRIFNNYFHLSLSQAAFNRGFFFIDFIVSFLGNLIGPLVSFIIYSTSKGLPGWTLSELFLFLGTNEFVFGIAGLVVFSMVFDASFQIEHGGFDSILLRPVRIIPFLIASSFNMWFTPNIILGISIIAYAIITGGIAITVSQFLLYAYLCFIGFLMYLGFAMLIVGINFKYHGFNVIINFFWEVKRLGSQPINIYSKLLSFTLTFIIPVSIANYYPAQALLGRLTDAGSIISVSLGILLFVYLCTKFLNYSVKGYTSLGG